MYVNDRTIDGYDIDELYEMWQTMSELNEKRKEKIRKLEEEIEELKLKIQELQKGGKNVNS